jgi:hypothetical protein
MKARIEYLNQRAVESVQLKNDKGYIIRFEGGANLQVDYPDEILQTPDLAGDSLLTVSTDDETQTLTFGRANTAGTVGQPTVLVIPPEAKFKVTLEGFDNEERDLSIPPHPDERVADGPEENDS